MPIAPRSWPLSSVLLALAGLTLVGAGLYFLFLRPPLLPEDIRYMGLSAAQLDAVRPRLEAWLTHVFLVMGGYVLATGVLIVTLAATSFRSHHWAAGIGALIGGAASIGWMAVVNFIIDFGLQMEPAGHGVAVGGKLGGVLVRESASEAVVLK